MSRQRQIAMKVMEYANEFTHWNFQMEQEGNSYLVGTALSNQKGQEITIYYLIGGGLAELQVISMNNKYDFGFLQKKLNEIALRYPVYAMGIGDEGISIKNPMPLEVLEKDMPAIVRERMLDMLQGMTDILNFK